MKKNKPNLILYDQFEIPTLELDLGNNRTREKIAVWRSLAAEITADWVRTNQFKTAATLWMWRSHSQRFHADGISAYINECGLPPLFLKHLQKQLKTIFGSRIEYIGTTWIMIERGWRPLCHIENTRVWQPLDAVQNKWMEVTTPEPHVV